MPTDTPPPHVRQSLAIYSYISNIVFVPLSWTKYLGHIVATQTFQPSAAHISISKTRNSNYPIRYAPPTWCSQDQDNVTILVPLRESYLSASFTVSEAPFETAERIRWQFLDGTEQEAQGNSDSGPETLPRSKTFMTSDERKGGGHSSTYHTFQMRCQGGVGMKKELYYPLTLICCTLLAQALWQRTAPLIAPTAHVINLALRAPGSPVLPRIPLRRSVLTRRDDGTPMSKFMNHSHETYRSTHSTQAFFVEATCRSWADKRTLHPMKVARPLTRLLQNIRR